MYIAEREISRVASDGTDDSVKKKKIIKIGKKKGLTKKAFPTMIDERTICILLFARVHACACGTHLL